MVAAGAFVVHAGLSLLDLLLFGFFVTLRSLLWVSGFFSVPFDLSLFWRDISLASRARILVSDSDFAFHSLRQSQILYLFADKFITESAVIGEPSLYSSSFRIMYLMNTLSEADL